MRLHKLSGAGWSGMRSKETCLQFDAPTLDRFDHYTAELRKRGVYYAFSPNYPFTLGPADRSKVEAPEEIYDGDGAEAEGNGSSVAYSSPVVQDLLIQWIKNLLNHVNPYTGLAYKDDPALAYIECINEESVLFYSNMPSIARKPTYKRMMAERFSDWLTKKYGSQEALVKAWGQAAFTGAQDAYPQESLDKRNIFPGGNPWYWDPAQLATSQKAYAKRYLDHMAFLAGAQDELYAKWRAGVRSTGYQGLAEHSNWQAGAGFSHYYNLHSDAVTGLIDRHNYFGGAGGISLGVGPFDNHSMLARPGSGLLSTGLQQVDGCSFALSEWIHVLPNEWSAEGPALIGAYGFGLQGWDMSFIFTQGNQEYRDRVDAGSIWNAFQPTIMGLFPAVARQVHRGDVREAPVVSTRKVCVPAFAEGRGLDVRDTTSQAHDVKSFDTDRVPTEALARGRLLVQFTDQPQASVATEALENLREAKTIESVTQQLFWTRGAGPRDGFVTINTPGTKAVVGFAKDKTFALGPVSISTRNRFAAVYVTCLDRADTDVALAGRLLVVAVARCRNTATKMDGTAGLLLDKGQAPVIVEPVRVELKIDHPGTPTVHVLDHDGRRTPSTVPVAGGHVVLDGAEHKTIYYEIAYQ